MPVDVSSRLCESMMKERVRRVMRWVTYVVLPRCREVVELLIDVMR